MTRATWLLVVDPCGGVIAVSPGAPPSWQRARGPADLEVEAPDVAAAVLELAAEVRAGAARARREIAVAAADVEIVALPAIVLHRSRAELATVIERALAPFRAQAAARDVLLRLAISSPSAVEAEIDAPKIAWVIATLVGNALRFARAGSRHAPGGTITVGLARVGDRAAIVVGDDGPGIPAEQLAKLFDPTRGAAVALAMAREVALAHGGDLTVTSETDGDVTGTEVTLTLPPLG